MDSTQKKATNASTSVSEEVERILYHGLQTIQEEDEREVVDHHPGPGCPKQVSSLALWWAFLLVLLRRKDSQRSVWRLLVTGRVPRCPRCDVTDQAIYDRLEDEGPSWLIRLYERLTAILRGLIDEALAQAPDSLRLAPFAHDVFILDETHLDPLHRLLPFLRRLAPGDPSLIPGKLVSLFDLRRQIWHAIRFEAEDPAAPMECAQPVLAGLSKGTLLLMDLGYYRFAWFDQLTKRGLFWISRLRRLTTWLEVHCYYRDGDTFDGIVLLGIWDYRAAYAVRLIQFRPPGSHQIYQYITNVCDPRQLLLPEIVELYQRRWSIERAFHVLKCVLGLGWLWSTKQSVLQAQVWGVLILAQILQTLRMLIALAAQVDPRDVSMILLGEWLADGPSSGSCHDWIVDGRACELIRAHRSKGVCAPHPSLDDYLPLPRETVLQQAGHDPDNLGEPLVSEQRSRDMRAEVRERISNKKYAEHQEKERLRQEQLDQANEKRYQRWEQQQSQAPVLARKCKMVQRLEQRREQVPREQWSLPPGYGIAPWYAQEQ